MSLHIIKQENITLCDQFINVDQDDYYNKFTRNSSLFDCKNDLCVKCMKINTQHLICELNMFMREISHLK